MASVTLLLIAMGLSASLAILSGWCGWIACWLWTNRIRRPAPRLATAGGLRRPTPTEDAGLLAAADDRMRATHRHDRTSVMHTHPADTQVAPRRIPDPRTDGLAATQDTQIGVAL